MKKGAPWLKTTLVQCAWAATRTNGSHLQAQFLRIRSRRGAKKAIDAVAASILTAAYHTLCQSRSSVSSTVSKTSDSTFKSRPERLNRCLVSDQTSATYLFSIAYKTAQRPEMPFPWYSFRLKIRRNARRLQQLLNPLESVRNTTDAGLWRTTRRPHTLFFNRIAGV